MLKYTLALSIALCGNTAALAQPDPPALRLGDGVGGLANSWAVTTISSVAGEVALFDFVTGATSIEVNDIQGTVAGINNSNWVHLQRPLALTGDYSVSFTLGYNSFGVATVAQIGYLTLRDASDTELLKVGHGDSWNNRFGAIDVWINGVNQLGLVLPGGGAGPPSQNIHVEIRRDNTLVKILFDGVVVANGIVPEDIAFIRLEFAGITSNIWTASFGQATIRDIVIEGLAPSFRADLNGDGVVNGSDLALLLVSWGILP